MISSCLLAAKVLLCQQKIHRVQKFLLINKTFDDIKKVLKHILNNYLHFYNLIINWPTKTSDDIEEDT